MKETDLAFCKLLSLFKTALSNLFYCGSLHVLIKFQCRLHCHTYTLALLLCLFAIGNVANHCLNAKFSAHIYSVQRNFRVK